MRTGVSRTALVERVRFGVVRAGEATRRGGSPALSARRPKHVAERERKRWRDEAELHQAAKERGERATARGADTESRAAARDGQRAGGARFPADGSQWVSRRREARTQSEERGPLGRGVRHVFRKEFKAKTQTLALTIRQQWFRACHNDAIKNAQTRNLPRLLGLGWSEVRHGQIVEDDHVAILPFVTVDERVGSLTE